MEKKRVLWLSDFNCSTGFATVAHNIVDQLLQTGKYDFDVVGINHVGEPYDFKRWPFAIYPAKNFLKARTDRRYADPYGRQRFFDLLSTGKYDIVFTLQDPFIIEILAEKLVEAKKLIPFQWIFYYPVDGKLKESWVNHSALLADFPVTYTEYGLQETVKIHPGANVRVINHGVDLKQFYPLADRKEFRRAYFKDHADQFIVTNVNRNQPRKDIPRTIAAFAAFHRQRPNSVLYLHMKASDVGGNVLDMAEQCGLRPYEEVLVPDQFNECQGYPVDVLNKIYNASDVILSTTLGEGWGLTATEAMAAKTPVMIPDHTACSEIGAEGRARLIRCGKEVVGLGAAGLNRYWPLTDFDDLVAALIDCCDHYAKYQEMAEKAYQWVRTLSWDRIGDEWRKLFELASASAHRE